MLILAKNIINEFSEPIQGALITIVDELGTTLVRNGFNIQRLSDAQGTFIIPALASDYLKIEHKNYTTQIVPSSTPYHNVRMVKAKSNNFLNIGLQQKHFIALCIICISAIVYIAFSLKNYK